MSMSASCATGPTATGVSLFGTWNDAVTSGYPEPTQSQWKLYGRSGPDNYDGTYSFGDTNYWRLHQEPYRLFYAAAPTHLRLTPSLSFDATPYAQYGYGNGPGGAVLPTSGLFEVTQPVQGTLGDRRRTGRPGDGGERLPAGQLPRRGGAEADLERTAPDHRRRGCGTTIPTIASRRRSARSARTARRTDIWGELDTRHGAAAGRPSAAGAGRAQHRAGGCAVRRRHDLARSAQADDRAGLPRRRW